MPTTPVTVRLSGDCRRFLLDVESPPLRADVRRLLEGAARLQSRPEYVVGTLVGMLRSEAPHLLEYVWALRAALAPSDHRHAVCERCLSAIDEGIRRSQTTTP